MGEKEQIKELTEQRDKLKKEIAELREAIKKIDGDINDR